MSIAASIQERARRAVEELPRGLDIGPPQTHAGLTVIPLFPTELVDKTGYLTLDGALAAGTFRVTEVSEAGSVPELQVINEGDTPVLLLDGEELIGAKQNRVLNVTVLAPPKRSIVIPVSCVEAGRWAHRGASMDFMAGEQLSYATLRKFSSSRVRVAAAAGRGYRSDQGMVWNDIAAKSERLGTSSRTGAMGDMFKARQRDLDSLVKAITADDRQIGAIFCIGDKVAGVELFDHPATLRSLLPKLVRSYAMDAIELKGDKHDAPSADAVKTFVRDIARSNKEVRASVGLGEDVRLSAPTLVGGALVLEGGILHLSAFPLDAEEQAGETSETTGRPTPRQSWLSSLRRRRNRRM